MSKIVKLAVPRPFVLFVEFEDGVHGEYDMTERMRGPVFVPMLDAEVFAQVRLADWGAPVWPNGVDIAPDALYERVRAAQA